MRIRKPSLLLFALGILTSPAVAAWSAVPAMDWTDIKSADFADNELDVPYMLEHFHTVANAVVEDGANRGFLNISVARNPEDNQPYNARIQENNLSLAYFYCTNRPWNRYYNSSAVKSRLEAMLEFWCNSQSPDGMFSEYGPKKWGLAPTGFGVQQMGQTLLLLNSGGPTIDPAILSQTMAAQRKAILCMLTNDQMYRWAADWSNQFTGVYFAALSYLRVKEDSELRAALEKGVVRAISVTQGPTGLLYEHGGLDFGYSHVHENNLRIAWPLLNDDPTIRDAVIDETKLYNRWRSYNLVLQPDRSGYFVNAGVDCRTKLSFSTYEPKRPSEVVETERCFAQTDVEHQQAVAKKRRLMESDWPHFKPLIVPGNTSYIPAQLFTAIADRDTFFPTQQQRDDAISKLPYLQNDNWTVIASDPRDFVYTYVRRPTYYCGFNSGRVAVKGFQNLGIGFIWNSRMGCVMQAVGGTDIAWGTCLSTKNKPVETNNLPIKLSMDGKVITPAPGYSDQPAHDLDVTYDLPDGGRKTIHFSEKSIDVEMDSPGEIKEQLPIVLSHASTVRKQQSVLVIADGKNVFRISASAPFDDFQVPTTEPTETIGKFSRKMAVLRASHHLQYSMQFE